MEVLSCRHGLEPNVTLHWFVHPQWFDDLGGWTEAKNIRHFVQWAELAFKHFGKKKEGNDYMLQPANKPDRE